MINEEYQKKQVVDFIGRLHTAIAKKPNTYIKPHAISFSLVGSGADLITMSTHPVMSLLISEHRLIHFVPDTLIEHRPSAMGCHQVAV